MILLIRILVSTEEKEFNDMNLAIKMQQSNRKHSGASDNSLTTTASTK